jgi:hypothetical protein
MSWKIETAVAALALSTSGILDALGRQKAGLLLLIAALTLGAGSGAASVLWLSDFRTWGPRIAALEQRMEAHVDTVSTPGLARITALERRQEEFRAIWDREWNIEAGGRLAIMAEQTHQVYCGTFPERCRSVPREEDDS